MIFFYNILEKMEIIEKYRKIYTLDDKIIPEFKITQLDSDILCDDTKYSIVRFLGKKQGLLNKKIRTLWLQNEGISITYYTMVTKPFTNYNYVTQIFFGDISDMNEICENLSRCIKLEKIFIHISTKPDLDKLLDILIKKKYPKFQGIFIHNNSTYFPTFYGSRLFRHIIRDYITGLEYLTERSEYIFTFINVSTGIISANLDQYKKLYNEFYDLEVKKMGRFITHNHKDVEDNVFASNNILISCEGLEILFPKFIDNKKQIKVMIIDDYKTLQYYTNVLVPAYREIGIELETLMVGSLHRILYRDSYIYDHMLGLYSNLVYIKSYKR